ncbi:hypothetical protein FGO68_gene16197 [Halteria grandinella]|uniref:Uncharacterized protein n=1 Tax=Halteria grandinella TaxID=5974 RepID=A0A8J8NC32_HALGN|nr:hypothetical protein FGO68_gene16197 [Halteria grandinella]
MWICQLEMSQKSLKICVFRSQLFSKAYLKLSRFEQSLQDHYSFTQSTSQASHIAPIKLSQSAKNLYSQNSYLFKFLIKQWPCKLALISTKHCQALKRLLSLLPLVPHILKLLRIH